MKIHVFHTGEVCVAPELPFGGEHCSLIKASGVFSAREKRLWLPVSAYLIQCEHGNILFDCGWHRDMSPNGILDKKAQVHSLGALALYAANQGRIEEGQAIDEQLAALGIRPADLDLVLLSHLDCDHANGLKLVADAKQILVSKDELAFAKNGTPVNRIRYNADWWNGTTMQAFDWNGMEGPAGKSYDVFGDGRLVMVNIPGHSKGLCALKITGSNGRFVLLFADGGYARKSWEQLITSGIADDKAAQKQSLQWIREQSLDANCVESIANHDPDVRPHVIKL
ncbi:MAG: N-acyl homoserine lactonase family protein [Clostridia bacterium]|nr:N-acyl homoserine lactonase family protein [Clostridia bacterium]